MHGSPSATASTMEMSRDGPPKQSPLEIEELLSAILSVTDRPTLLSCCLVARFWYIPAMHALWRYVQWKPLLAEGADLFLDGLAKYGRYTLELQDNTMADMELIARHCPHLHCLRLSITTPQDKTLADLLQSAPRISSLHLFCCRQLSGQALQGVAILSQLQTLDLRNLQQVAELPLLSVFSSCPNLKYLYLEDVNLAGVTLARLEQSLKLETISLIRSQPGRELVSRLLQNSPQLNTLSLARNYRVTLPDWTQREIYGSLGQLTVVNLESCRLISSTAMQALFSSCPLLVRVNVMGTAIEDAALMQLAIGCHGLERLNLGFCHHITDNGTRYVLDHCRQLKAIDLTSHLGLTARLFFGAPWRCSALESIVLVDINMHWPEHHEDHQERESVIVTSKTTDDNNDDVSPRSDPNHAAMFEQLSQLQHLKDLTLGGSIMNIRLSDGLAKLAELPCLESWHVRQLEGTLGEDEIRWLIEAWPTTLRRVRYDRDTLPKPWMRYYRRRRPRLLFA